MFTWICPKCGSEVPPSESDCPTCRAEPRRYRSPHLWQLKPRLHHNLPAAVPTAPPTSPPVSNTDHRRIASPDPPPYATAPEYHPTVPQRRPLSPALVAAATAAGICALLAVLYLFVLPRRPPADATSLESPSRTPASLRPGHAHPLAKYVEIAGLRVMEDNRGQVKIGYIVVNHSPADLPDLRARITLSAAGKPVFEFPTTIPSIGPYESKDLTATVKTNLRPYELPDWQALKPRRSSSSLNSRAGTPGVYWIDFRSCTRPFHDRRCRANTGSPNVSSLLNRTAPQPGARMTQ